MNMKGQEIYGGDTESDTEMEGTGKLKNYLQPPLLGEI
jgi:hypothetical protein